MPETPALRVARTTRLHVGPPGAPLFDDGVTTVEIVDEAAGEFVAVRQPGAFSARGDGEIRIDPEEWPAIRDAISRMVDACRPFDDQEAPEVAGTDD